MSRLRELTDELAARKARAAEMGGPERIAKQHARGKLTARERLALLFDGGHFDELAVLGKQPGVESPADAVVVGFGKVDGRPVGVVAYDFTVLGGSMGPTGGAGYYAMIDDVIDPRQTRAVVARALERFADKRVERPWRKRGIVPV